MDCEHCEPQVCLESACDCACHEVSRAAAALGRRGGLVGGLTKGATKVRGDAAFYRQLARLKSCRRNYAPNTYCARRKDHDGPCAGHVQPE